MSSASKCAWVWMLGVACALPLAAAQLRVCADPNNLPYSNVQQQGFENRIADLIAKDLNMQVSYFWFPQWSDFFQATLQRGMCDVVMGVPAQLKQAATTQPYYRSSYVFIARKDRHLEISSFDDPRLRTLKIGVHILDDPRDTLPPVHSLTRRGIVRNLVGFSIYGNLYEKNPSADLIRAVESGKVDVAVAWGPLAGYYAEHSRVPLEVTPVTSDPEYPDLPLAFNIGIGVRAGDTALKQSLDAELVKKQAEIEAILRSYGVPQLSMATETAKAMED